jgi:hypothetical protein
VLIILSKINLFTSVIGNAPNVEGLSAMTAWVLVCILFVAGSLLAYTSILIKKYRADEVGAISLWKRTKISLKMGVLCQSFKTFHARNLQIFIISNAPNVAGLSAITALVLVCIHFVAACLLAFTSILIRKYRADEVGAISKWPKWLIEQKLAYRL